jgi:hypothetical protein
MAQLAPGGRQVSKFGYADKNLDVLKVGHGLRAPDTAFLFSEFVCFQILTATVPF